MSGICGILNLDGAPIDPGLLQRMTAASAYRGQDGIQHWIQGNIGLAHLARHATPESQREHQPLVNRRGDLVLVADAIVYNRTELIQVLSARTLLQEQNSTDADLILAAYECWGESCPDHLNGDFAFAIWDILNRKLFCARDGQGIRLFHYHWDRQTFRFATDVDQILVDERIPRSLDGYAVSDFLTQNGRDQSRTLFAEVQNLLPGHCLVVEAGGPRAWRHWNPENVTPLNYRQDDEYVGHFRDLLTCCVTDRLRSIKNSAAIMVSGGLDSSSIAALVQRGYRQGETVTRPAGYVRVPEGLPDHTELEYCRLLAAETGLDLRPQFFIRPGSAFEEAPLFAPNMNTPAMYNLSPLWEFLRQVAQDGSDVLLRGDGGDVLFFAARGRYREQVRAGQWRSLLPWIVESRRQGDNWGQILRGYFLSPLLPRRLHYWYARWRDTGRFGHVPRWLHPELLRRAGTWERLYRQGYPPRFDSPTRQAMYEWFIGLGLQTPATEIYHVFGDRHGLQARFPFLDRRLMEFMLAVPLHLVAQPGRQNTKWLLRQAMQGILPEPLRCAAKIPGRPPAPREWCAHHAAQLTTLFSDPILTRNQLIHDKIFLQELDQFCRGVGYTKTGQFFSLAAVLEKWLRLQAREGIVTSFRVLRDWQIE
jgi:asparagine synthase (glutamine-hydrolysing)